jgi:hypothetical protein
VGALPFEGDGDPRTPIQEGRAVMQTATLESLDHEFDEEDWEEDDEELPGTDEEELDLDELEEEDAAADDL